MNDGVWIFWLICDWTADGLRPLSVVDNFTRHSQLIETDFTLTGSKVVAALKPVAQQCRYPKMILVDSGNEFASKVIDAWANAKRNEPKTLLPIQAWKVYR